MGNATMKMLPSLVYLFVLWGAEAAEAQSLQFIEAWQNGIQLPSSTNQVTDDATCRSVNAANAQLAPTFGYVLDDLAADRSSVTYRDAQNGVTVKQSCRPASPWMEALPKRPLSGDIPPLPPTVPCPAPTPQTLVLLPLGQSVAANNAESRYTAGPHTFMFSSGHCYPLTDPIVAADSNDGSVWSRLADRLMSTGRYDNIVVMGAAESGSSITQWAPGGNLNAHLLYKIQNSIESGLPVTHMVWDQGVADLGMGATTWRDHFLAMLGTIRPYTSAPIYVARSATCSIRSGNMTPAQIDQLTRNGPNVYVSNEIHKSWIRRGQQHVVNGSGVRAGPDLEIGPEFLYDGCHPSRVGAAIFAQRWLDALSDAP